MSRPVSHCDSEDYLQMDGTLRMDLPRRNVQPARRAKPLRQSDRRRSGLFSAPPDRSRGLGICRNSGCGPGLNRPGVAPVLPELGELRTPGDPAGRTERDPDRSPRHSALMLAA
jgi:hypothetical protein